MNFSKDWQLVIDAISTAAQKAYYETQAAFEHMYEIAQQSLSKFGDDLLMMLGQMATEEPTKKKTSFKDWRKKYKVSKRYPYIAIGVATTKYNKTGSYHKRRACRRCK